MTPPADLVETAVPRALPQPLTWICVGLAGLGAATFLVGLVADAETTWWAFHVNYLYFGTLAQAGAVLASIFVIVGATWPGPVRRLAEGLAAWVPVTFVLGVIGIFGRHHVYPWIEHPIEAKQAWLNPVRMYATDLAILGLLAIVTVLFLKNSVRPALRESADQIVGPRELVRH